ncbi:hypothetical protein COP2_023137 [Malus domestica]
MLLTSTLVVLQSSRSLAPTELKESRARAHAKHSASRSNVAATSTVHLTRASYLNTLRSSRARAYWASCFFTEHWRRAATRKREVP